MADEKQEEHSINAPSKSEWTLRACLTVLGTSCILFSTVGFLNAFGVFEQYYAETYFRDKSLSAISWFGSFNIFCMFGGALVSGILNDIYGPKWLLRTGTVMALLGLFMTSLCTKYYQFFLAQAMLFGFGVAALFLPGFATIPLYFTKHRGLALGITIGGSSLGGVIWPIALRRLLVDIGFPWTMRTAAFIMMPLLVIGCLTVRLPVNTHPGQPKPKPDINSMKTPAFGLLAVFMFLASMGLFIPFFYITSYSISIGKDPDMSFYLISILNGISLLGRLLPGILADRYGAFNLTFLATFFSGLICCCMTTAKTLGGLIAIAAAYGFASGAILSLQGACATKLVGPESYGAAMGSMMAVCSIAGLIGTPIAGELATKYGYLALAEYGGASLLVGSFFVMASKLKQNKNPFAAI
ncbi:MFS general substrate transporter [Lentithecium fluviatile CBS 122367]|uniref:MFS general substrate transporter n=1 Tax=Lentithecium fluviatile CBS 122367 TaxID=1168545 RepID=A0A6G1J7L0_9PLEO|nr:MFS general substrate transporter [Lentithecium fluviatile CBS 122367]